MVKYACTFRASTERSGKICNHCVRSGHNRLMRSNTIANLSELLSQDCASFTCQLSPSILVANERHGKTIPKGQPWENIHQCFRTFMLKCNLVNIIRTGWEDCDVIVEFFQTTWPWTPISSVALNLMCVCCGMLFAQTSCSDKVRLNGYKYDFPPGATGILPKS